MESLSIKAFTEQINVRLTPDLLEEVKEYVNLNKDIYNSISHYARCAIIEKIRKERNK